MTRQFQLTIRPDARLQREIRTLARRDGVSMNQAALRLIAKGAGLQERSAPDQIGSSLDHLIGTWSDDDSREFLASIESCRQIDPELWD